MPQYPIRRETQPALTSPEPRHRSHLLARLRRPWRTRDGETCGFLSSTLPIPLQSGQSLVPSRTVTFLWPILMQIGQASRSVGLRM